MRKAYITVEEARAMFDKLPEGSMVRGLSKKRTLGEVQKSLAIHTDKPKTIFCITRCDA
jgi:hypothetical protein